MIRDYSYPAPVIPIALNRCQYYVILNSRRSKSFLLHFRSTGCSEKILVILHGGMGRPPKVNELLGNTSSAKDETYALSQRKELVRPKFLSKLERERSTDVLVTNGSRVALSNNVGGRKRRRDQGTENELEPEEERSQSRHSSPKRSKFSFDWSNSSDTLADYKPIVETRISSLLDVRRARGSLESAYLGKRWQDKALEEMTDRDWRIFREDFEISTKGGSIENPMRNWHELGILKKDIRDIIVNGLGFKDPTPIQRVTIPNVCSKRNRDFLGVASTGSGKTLAFVIPILIKMSNTQPRPPVVKAIEGPKALILAPTRELAQQIQAEAQKITNLWNSVNSQLSCQVVSIVGGHSIEEITYEVSKGCDILVATPGRLIDSLENHVLSIKQIETFVLDEADKMIDLGFEEQLKKLLTNLETNSEVPDKRQTLMFTATMSPSIERIANGYLKTPAYATIGGGEASIPQIQQIVRYSPSEEQRFQRIRGLLDQFKPPIIIFITYKKTADWLAEKFYKETSFKVTVLHGSKSQEQREHSLQLLRTGKVQIMIATNVAARGLDIPNVSLVVNFQTPKYFEDYVHRIGRTGRAGKRGTAITFLGDEENPHIAEELWSYVRRNDPTNSNVFDTTLKDKYNVGKKQLEEIIH